MGRLQSEEWLTGGIPVQTQTFTYDDAGRLEAAIDPDGTYTFAYDAADRVTSVQEPFELALTFAYDDVGNRTGVQDSKGGVTTVAFDAVNRQTSEQVGGAGISAMRFDYAYTDRGEVESLTRYSDLAGTTMVGTTTYDHDAAGRLTAIDHDDGSASSLASYAYAYDAANRLAVKTENGTPLVLMFVILSVATGAKERGLLAGVAVGAVIALEALFAGPVSGANMNPARSIAPAAVSGTLDHLWVYLTAPPLGAALAVIACKTIHQGGCCSAPTREDQRS